LGYIRTVLSVAETPLFVKQSEAIFSEDEKQELLAFLAKNPMSGDVIPGTGGVRKLRFQASGRGKRGGARVIYFYFDDDHPLTVLMAYAKSTQENISPKGQKMLSEIAAEIKAAIRGEARSKT